MVEASINCPKCFNKMEEVEFKSIIVERCTFCRGIWFDAMEDDKLKSIKGASQLDIGDANVGKEWNKDTEINCPRCRYPMNSKVDREQSHITYEMCSRCHGVFFDAGEFKDYQEHTVMETIKSFFGR